MVDSHNGTHEGYIVATAYAGGGANGGAPSALDENALTQGTDTLIAFDEPVEVDFPKIVQDKKKEKDITGTIYTQKSKVVLTPPLEGRRLSYLQTDDMFDIAISGTYGAIPTTIEWHHDNAITENDSFGTAIEELIIHAKVGNYTYQDMKTISRAKNAGTMTPIAYQTSARATFENIHKTNTVFDSKTATSLVLNEVKLTIQNELEKGDKVYGPGDLKIQHPVLKGRKVMLEIWCLERNSNTWKADAENTTPQLIDATIEFSSFLTVTMTNLEPVDHDENTVKNGIKQHYYMFEDGVGFTIA